MIEQFTPGPWFCKKDLVTIFSEEGDICDLVTSSNGKQMPVESNGFLISAAPEMYEFIRWLRSLNGQCAILNKKNLPEIMDRAAEILRKARGEE